MINALIGKIYSKFEGNNRLERIWKLASVDFKSRYYNTKLGVLWTILNPAFQITIYYFVFKYIRVTSEENFILFLYVGLISFAAFTMLAIKGLNVVQSKRYLFANIQFNKFDMFWSMTLSVLMSFLVDLSIFFIAASFLGGVFNWHSLWMILIIFQILGLGLGLATFLAVIKIHFTDIGNFWRIISFTLFWTSGVIYSGEEILKQVPEVLYLNPLIGILVNVRNVFLYGLELNYHYFITNTFHVVFILLGSIYLINKNWHLALEKL